MMQRLLKTALAAALAACLMSPVTAQAPLDVVEGEILPGWRTVGSTHMAAIRLTLAPGWKTYWRAPGDAGIPPRLEWAGSENLRRADLHWPVPEVTWQNGIRSVGYSGQVVVPVELQPERPGGEIALRARMEIGVCDDICIPVTLELAGMLPAAGEGAGAEAIRRALAKRPMTAAEARVGAVRCRVEPISDGLRVTVAVEMPRLPGREETVVEYADRSIWISEPATRREGGWITAVAEMVPPAAQPFAMGRGDVRITVIADGRAVDIRGCTAG